MISIPIDNSLPWTSQRVTMDDVEYILELAWNTRDARWYLGLYDSAGNAIVTGVAIVVDYPLLSRFGYASIPKGHLIAVDTTGEGEISEIEHLGTRVQLVYMSEEEVAVG